MSEIQRPLLVGAAQRGPRRPHAHTPITRQPQSTAARTPGARWPRTAHAASWHPSFGLRAQAVFCNHRLQHLLVQTQVGHQSLQARVLILQRSPTLRLPDIHAAKLRLPCVDRCLVHATLAGHVIHRAPSFDLLQRSDDLRLRMPAPPPLRRNPNLCGSRGAGQAPTIP